MGKFINGYKAMRCWNNGRFKSLVKAFYMARGREVYLSRSLWIKPRNSRGS